MVVFVRGAYGGRGRIPHISYARSRAIRTSILDCVSTCSLYLAGNRPQCLCVSLRWLWKKFSLIYVVIAPEPSAHGNLDITSTFPRWRTLFAQYLARQWRHVMFLVSSRLNLDKLLKFLVNCSSDLVVDSRPAGHFHVLQRGEMCTVRASIAWTARAYGAWNLDIISSAPCIRQARCRCLTIA